MTRDQKEQFAEDLYRMTPTQRERLAQDFRKIRKVGMLMMAIPTLGLLGIFLTFLVVEVIPAIAHCLTR